MCKADRLHGQTGFCRVTSELLVARAALHMWEEPCISGEHGSGAVFFSGCALGCVFCQNRTISGGQSGKQITIKRLSEIFLELQEKGAHNINLVTPDHYVPSIVTALDLARDNGLHLPVIYNGSGYTNPETIKLLEGYIDAWLPDFKYCDADIAKRYAHAPDYFEIARQTLSEMYRQTGDAVFDADGMIQKGIIVRHLALPEHLDDSRRILTYLYNTYGDHIYISIMNQFTPVPQLLPDYPELNRTISQDEYEALVDDAIALGIENGFIQEGETASESFIPPFDNEGV
jgi:putative pyruvate formate lyase activating enzyme